MSTDDKRYMWLRLDLPIHAAAFGDLAPWFDKWNITGSVFSDEDVRPDRQTLDLVESMVRDYAKRLTEDAKRLGKEAQALVEPGKGAELAEHRAYRILLRYQQSGLMPAGHPLYEALELLENDLLAQGIKP